MIAKRDRIAADVTTGPRRGAPRVIIVTLTATAIAATLAGCSGTVAPTSPPPASPAPAATPAHHHAHGVTGQLTAINGSTWTVHTTHGQDMTVTLTPQTQFGTKKTPATAQQFTIGDTVRVIGTRDHTTLTATHISTAHPSDSTSPPTETTPAPPS